MLQVRLLGQFDIRLDGHPVEIASRPAQSLLAYLLINQSKPHRREKLAGQFWPDADELNARSNLRHALWRIRKALEPLGYSYLYTNDLVVTFSLQPGDWLDAAFLDSKKEQDPSTEELLEMVAAYGGELLPGFYEEWVLLERDRLQSVFDRKMDRLLEHLLIEKRWDETLEWCERWIACRHTPEPAYRALMLVHAVRGDQASAATAYQRCVEALQRELGVKPSTQTRRVFEEIQAGIVEL